jgi:hypothetical protein
MATGDIVITSLVKFGSDRQKRNQGIIWANQVRLRPHNREFPLFIVSSVIPDRIQAVAGQWTCYCNYDHLECRLRLLRLSYIADSVLHPSRLASSTLQYPKMVKSTFAATAVALAGLAGQCVASFPDC